MSVREAGTGGGATRGGVAREGVSVTGCCEGVTVGVRSFAATVGSTRRGGGVPIPSEDFEGRWEGTRIAVWHLGHLAWRPAI